MQPVVIVGLPVGARGAQVELLRITLERLGYTVVILASEQRAVTVDIIFPAP